MQPIHFATMTNHADIVELLIDKYGVDVHSKDEVCMLHYVLVYVCMYEFVLFKVCENKTLFVVIRMHENFSLVVYGTIVH